MEARAERVNPKKSIEPDFQLTQLIMNKTILCIGFLFMEARAERVNPKKSIELDFQLTPLIMNKTSL